MCYNDTALSDNGNGAVGSGAWRYVHCRTTRNRRTERQHQNTLTGTNTHNTMTTQDTYISQKNAVLQHLRDHGTITPIEALNKYGCFRLGAHIFELRQEGHKIATTMRYAPNGRKRWAEYSLNESN